MITDNFRMMFKKELGSNFEYSPKVSLILFENNELNRNKKPHSPFMIRNVFTGRAQNDAIESAIYQVYKDALELKQKTKELKRSITKE